MIHAFLFLTCPSACRASGGHGLEFQSLMNHINSLSSLKITIYHTFHDEVLSFKKHIWKCSGPCSQKPPYFGIVRRAINRPPGYYDYWWQKHDSECGGKFEKIGEPEGKENVKVNEQKKKKKITSIPLSSSEFNNIDKQENNSVNFLQIVEKNKGSNEISQPNLPFNMLVEESGKNVIKKTKANIKNKNEYSTIDKYFIEEEAKKPFKVKKIEGFEFLYDYEFCEKKFQLPSKILRFTIYRIRDEKDICQILINQKNTVLILYEIILIIFDFDSFFMGDLFLDKELNNSYDFMGTLEEIKNLGICQLYFKENEDIYSIEYEMEYLEKENISDNLRNAFICPVVCNLDFKGKKYELNEKIKLFFH